MLPTQQCGQQVTTNCLLLDQFCLGLFDFATNTCEIILQSCADSNSSLAAACFQNSYTCGVGSYYQQDICADLCLNQIEILEVPCFDASSSQICSTAYFNDVCMENCSNSLEQLSQSCFDQTTKLICPQNDYFYNDGCWQIRPCQPGENISDCVCSNGFFLDSQQSCRSCSSGFKCDGSKYVVCHNTLIPLAYQVSDYICKDRQLQCTSAPLSRYMNSENLSCLICPSGFQCGGSTVIRCGQQSIPNNNNIQNYFCTEQILKCIPNTYINTDNLCYGCPNQFVCDGSNIVVCDQTSVFNIALISNYNCSNNMLICKKSSNYFIPESQTCLTCPLYAVCNGITAVCDVGGTAPICQPPNTPCANGQLLSDNCLCIGQLYRTETKCFSCFHNFICDGSPYISCGNRFILYDIIQGYTCQNNQLLCVMPNNFMQPTTQCESCPPNYLCSGGMDFLCVPGYEFRDFTCHESPFYIMKQQEGFVVFFPGAGSNLIAAQGYLILQFLSSERGVFIGTILSRNYKAKQSFNLSDMNVQIAGEIGSYLTQLVDSLNEGLIMQILVLVQDSSTGLYVSHKIAPYYDLPTKEKFKLAVQDAIGIAVGVLLLVMIIVVAVTTFYIIKKQRAAKKIHHQRVDIVQKSNSKVAKLEQEVQYLKRKLEDQADLSKLASSPHTSKTKARQSKLASTIATDEI